jgi:hypothetical protein
VPALRGFSGVTNVTFLDLRNLERPLSVQRSHDQWSSGSRVCTASSAHHRPLSDDLCPTTWVVSVISPSPSRAVDRRVILRLTSRNSLVGLRKLSRRERQAGKGGRHERYSQYQFGCARAQPLTGGLDGAGRSSEGVVRSAPADRVGGAIPGALHRCLGSAHHPRSLGSVRRRRIPGVVPGRQRCSGHAVHRPGRRQLRRCGEPDVQPGTAAGVPGQLPQRILLLGGCLAAAHRRGLRRHPGGQPRRRRQPGPRGCVPERHAHPR